MPYTSSGQWYPDPSSAGGRGGAGAPAGGRGGPAGMVWDPVAGGYVAPSQSRQTEAQTKVQENLAATTAPDYSRPMSASELAASQLALQQLGETTRSHQASEGLSASQLAEQQREAQASEGLASSKFEQTKADRASALAALNGMWNGGNVPMGIATTSDPGAPGGGGADLTSAAEAAALTSAKERSGERLSSSLRGLREMMAERGIGGSGIEAANTRGLVGGALQDMNDTERGIIQGRVGRAQQVEDRNFAAQQAANQQRIQVLLSLYGMAY